MLSSKLYKDIFVELVMLHFEEIIDHMRDIYRSLSLIMPLLLILMISGMFLISNLAVANIGGETFLHEQKSELVQSSHTERQVICEDACGTSSRVNCIQHCELSHAVSVFLSPIPSVHPLMNPHAFYRTIKPDHSFSVELKPPQSRFI